MEPLSVTTIAFGGVLGPALTELAKRLSGRWQWLQDAQLWAAVNLILTVGIYLAVWLVADGTRAHLVDWMTSALAAAGLGGAGANLWRKKVNPGSTAAGAVLLGLLLLPAAAQAAPQGGGELPTSAQLSAESDKPLIGAAVWGGWSRKLETGLAYPYYRFRLLAENWEMVALLNTSGVGTGVARRFQESNPADRVKTVVGLGLGFVTPFAGSGLRSSAVVAFGTIMIFPPKAPRATPKTSPKG